MSLAYRCSLVLKRISIELLEFFAAAQFLPVCVLLGIVGQALFITSAALFGFTVPAFPMIQTMLRFPLWEELFFTTTILYIFFRSPRLVRHPSLWWSVRRKASIVLSCVSVLYMGLFTLLFFYNHQVVPLVWIELFGMTVIATLYAFCIRYITNKLVHRMNRPDFYQSVARSTYRAS